MSTATVVNVAGREVPLTNLDKPLWPARGLTKAHLVRYMLEVGPWLLPHLQERPLTVVRFPDGVEGKHFYQKDCPNHAPEWVERHAVQSGEGERTIEYIVANDLPTLVWLANQAAIELHPWMSTRSLPDFPNYAVVDLDPTEGASFDKARQAAEVAWEWLKRLKVRSYPKTSGATGIHILIPLEPIYPYAVTSRFVGLIGHVMARSHPEWITVERWVKRRPQQAVYVDHLQNLPGKTVAAPLSPRPHPLGTVSAPFDWNELADIHPEQFTLDNVEVVKRAALRSEGILADRQRLEEPLARLRTYL